MDGDCDDDTAIVPGLSDPDTRVCNRSIICAKYTLSSDVSGSVGWAYKG